MYQIGSPAMMALIFVTMTLALAGLFCGPRWFAVAAAVTCLALSAGLFLFEVHNPEDGFSMPWLKVEVDGPGNGASA